MDTRLFRLLPDILKSLRLFGLILLLFPSLSLAQADAAPKTATTENQTESHMARIQRRGNLRICIWPDYYAISYRNPRTGNLEGMDILMAQALAEELGVTPHFVDSSFKTLADDLRTDRCDISMHGIAITPARREVLDFSHPTLHSGIAAVTLRSHPTIREWGDIDQPGVVVAVQAGTYMVDVARRDLAAAQIVVVQSTEAREQEVTSGRADVFLTDYPYSRRLLTRADWAKLLLPPQPWSPLPYAYAIAKGDPAWLATVNDFVARSKADGRLLQAARSHGLDAIVVLE